MNCPEPLYSGDTIGLIAPCSPVTKERLIQCIQTISSYGLEVILGKSCHESLYGYLAGDDSVRANDINTMFSNPKIKAIFCLRGGYGSTRILSLLDYPMIKNHPKIFVGYSDVTTFHLAFHRFCNFITFHGPMVSSNMVDDMDSYTKESFFEALSNPSSITFHNPADKTLIPIAPGQATGRLVGGCLSLVAPSIGTFYQPDFHNKILFLEDIEESIPRCDKLMQQLLHAGILDQINGILLGNFKDCTNPRDESYTIEHYFKDLFASYSKPVLWGIQSGHQKPMATLPLGSICSMDTEQLSIRFDYSS